MENVRDHRTLNLTHEVEKLEWATKQPTYRLHCNIHENLVSIERWKDTVVLEKLIYRVGGFTIIDVRLSL